MNVRDLSRLLSRTLHVPAERWAARLVRGGLLPRSNCQVVERDAAVLLLAVMAARDPEDAGRAVVALAELPLLCAWSENADSRLHRSWASCTDAEYTAMFTNPVDAIVAAIEVENDPVGPFIFGSLKVEEGGATAVLHGCLGDDYLHYRARYAWPGSSFSGLTRLTEIRDDVIQPIATALLPPVDPVISHDKSSSIIH